jgi:hypothetical protein
LVVRAVGDSEARTLAHSFFLFEKLIIMSVQTEKGVDAQKRIMDEFYSTVEDYDVST